jgi:hypothetical protein
VIVDFNRRGIMQLLKRMFARSRTTSPSEDAPDYQMPLREPSR